MLLNMNPSSPQPTGIGSDLKRDRQLASLASQQRRLRHIRNISARNVQFRPIGDQHASISVAASIENPRQSPMKMLTSGDKEVNLSRVQMYYTLHTQPTAQHEANNMLFLLYAAFYTSEKIRASMSLKLCAHPYASTSKQFQRLTIQDGSSFRRLLNPVWRNVNLDLELENVNNLSVDLSSEDVVVRVWYCDDSGSASLCVHWSIHLSGLVYLGTNVTRDQIYRYAHNSLILGLRDGFYGSKDHVLIDPVSVTPPALTAALSAERPLSTDVVVSNIRQSYTVRSLMRVQTVLRAVRQTEDRVVQIRQSISQKLEHNKSLQAKLAEREMALLRVAGLREDVQWRMLHQQQHLKTALEQLQQSNSSREQVLNESLKRLAQDSDDLHERKKSYFDVRERLLKTGAKLIHRRKQLLAELSFIFPIQQIPNSDNTIVNVRLPQSEDLLGHNETMLAVALGYTCHLVLMISSCLDTPLRYPMEHRGSRSVVYDYIIESLPDKEREFPLYCKGKQKYQFQYGVYLLNKNIAQLRNYCGMSTPDLRTTLYNLSTLLCDRLGVSPNDAFSNRHRLVPPSFGGPQQKSHSRTVQTLSHPASSPSLVPPRVTATLENSMETHAGSVSPMDQNNSGFSHSLEISQNSSISQSLGISPILSANTDHLSDSIEVSRTFVTSEIPSLGDSSFVSDIKPQHLVQDFAVDGKSSEVGHSMKVEQNFGATKVNSSSCSDITAYKNGKHKEEDSRSDSMLDIEASATGERENPDKERISPTISLASVLIKKSLPDIYRIASSDSLVQDFNSPLIGGVMKLGDADSTNQSPAHQSPESTTANQSPAHQSPDVTAANQSPASQSPDVTAANQSRARQSHDSVSANHNTVLTGLDDEILPVVTSTLDSSTDGNAGLLCDSNVIDFSKTLDSVPTNGVEAELNCDLISTNNYNTATGTEPS